MNIQDIANRQGITLEQAKAVQAYMKENTRDVFHRWRNEHWYRDLLNYQLNAKNYLEYLAKLQHFINIIEEYINEMLDRLDELEDNTITVADTPSVDITLSGDWTSPDDTINIKADVVLSQTSVNNVLRILTDGLDVAISSKDDNAINKQDDGLYSFDLATVLNPNNQALNIRTETLLYTWPDTAYYYDIELSDDMTNYDYLHFLVRELNCTQPQDVLVSDITASTGAVINANGVQGAIFSPDFYTVTATDSRHIHVVNRANITFLFNNPNDSSTPVGYLRADGTTGTTTNSNIIYDNTIGGTARIVQIFGVKYIDINPIQQTAVERGMLINE